MGQVLGGGAAIGISRIDFVQYTDLCIYIDVARDPVSYPVLDLGYANEELTIITPLQLGNVTVKEVDGEPVLCVRVSIDKLPKTDTVGEYSVTLFPIETIENPESYDPEYLKSSTAAMVYTLGALYILVFLLLAIFLFNMTREVIHRRTAIPVVAYIAFVFTILCIFRICFMFIYAAGGFDDNPLAEFVVFEIPTFLLFTTVILALGFWQKLVKQKTFFATSETGLMVAVLFAIFMVWTLFAVITIVYAEAILTKELESPCPGRVAPSTQDIDDSTRTLFIVYQVTKDAPWCGC